MTLSKRLKRNIAVSENGFVFNPGSGESFTVNPVGFEILNLFRKGLSEQEIVASIIEEYAVDSQTIERDLIDFMDMMQQYRLVYKEDE